MKIKLGEIVNSVEALNKIVELKLPIKKSYELSKLIKLFATEVSIFEEKRNALVKELGEKKEDDSFIVTKENLSKFYEEISKVNDIEVDYEFEKIKISELGDISLEAKYIVDFIFE